MQQAGNAGPDGLAFLDLVEPASPQARHAVVDLSQVLRTVPQATVNRISSAEITRLQELLAGAGLHLRNETIVEQELAELRATYEPFVSALAERMLVSLPPWIPPKDSLDDWQTSAWDDQFPSFRQALDKVRHPR